MLEGQTDSSLTKMEGVSDFLDNCILALVRQHESMLIFRGCLEGGDAPRDGRKQAPNLVGSVQDNMDVRVEATKAALCVSMSSEHGFAGTHT